MSESSGNPYKNHAEYAGWVLETPFNLFKFTPANKGTEAGSDAGVSFLTMSPSSRLIDSRDPANTVKAYYHTHGGYDIKYGMGNEEFSTSGGDIDFANRYQIDGYVGTPYGSIKKYDYTTKTITELFKAGVTPYYPQ